MIISELYLKKEIEVNQSNQKEPLDNTLKALQRQKSEKDNNNINNNENDSLENLNINLINKDNENINEEKNKKINIDEYKEEDIKSQIALTENSYDNTLDLSIKEKSKLKIVNEDENQYNK